MASTQGRANGPPQPQRPALRTGARSEGSQLAQRAGAAGTWQKRPTQGAQSRFGEGRHGAVVPDADAGLSGARGDGGRLAQGLARLVRGSRVADEGWRGGRRRVT